MDRFDRVTLLIISVCGVAVLLASWWYLVHVRSAVPPDSPRARVFSEAAQFTSHDGEEITIVPNRDEFLVIHTWATWCPVCHTSITEFATVSEQFSGQPVRFLAINRKEASHTTARFLQQYSFPASLEILHDTTDHVFTELEGYTAPETVIIAPSGASIYHRRDSFQSEELMQVLEEALTNSQ